MTYKVGTRVKKVAGSDQGDTGVVVPCDDEGTTPEECGYAGVDICIRCDQDFIDEDGDWAPAGTVAFCRSFQWEPIIPEGSKVGEFSFKELMNNLKETENVKEV